MVDDEVLRYREVVRSLIEENNRLRQAADTFGRLAERLNVQLQEERRAQRNPLVNEALLVSDPRSAHAAAK